MKPTVAAAAEHVGHLCGRPLLVDDPLALFFADAQQPVVDVRVVERAGDAGGFKAERRQHVAEDFPVAVMAGEQDHARDRVCISRVDDLIGNSPSSTNRAHVSMRIRRVVKSTSTNSMKSCCMLRRASCSRCACRHVGKAAAQVPEAAIAMLLVKLIDERAKQSGGFKIGVDREAVQRHRHHAQADVLKAVDPRIPQLSHAGVDDNVMCRAGHAAGCDRRW